MRNSYTMNGLTISLDIYDKGVVTDVNGHIQDDIFVALGTIDFQSKDRTESYPFMISKDDNGIWLMSELQIQFDENLKIYGAEKVLFKNPSDAEEYTEELAMFHDGLSAVFAGFLSSM